MYKASIGNIIRLHFKSFRTLGQVNDKMPPIEVGKLFVLPGAISVAILIIAPDQVVIDGADIIKTVAIFGAFFFNLLVFLYNIRTAIIKENKGDLVNKFAAEINSNISFSILLSLLLLIIVLPSKYVLNLDSIIVPLYSFLVYYVTCFYIITLVNVLKKLFLILEIER